MRIDHRNLKPHNILVRCAKSINVEGHGYMYAKVAHFGLCRSKVKYMTFSCQTLKMGTTRWLSPKMLKHKNDDEKMKYPFKSNIHNFGRVCYEILSENKHFFVIGRNMDVRSKILTHDHIRLPH